MASMIFSHSLIVNCLALSCIFTLVLFANHGRRTNGCEDNAMWSKPDFSFMPCNNHNLPELYECGYRCRVNRWGAGACSDDTCMCCTMEDPNNSFPSRGYSTPCTENMDDHERECDASCYKQGANYGECNEDGTCQCNGNPAGTRRIGCDDRDHRWSEPGLSFTPCDNTNLEHLYDCGSECRKQNLGVGACFYNRCSCCAMEDPTAASFKSRGYSVPCEENVEDHEVKCKDSCYNQGSNDGECFEGSCHCIGVIPAGIGTSGCEYGDNNWLETELSFSPCDDTDLDRLYECGFYCRQQKSGVGACVSNKCMCCAMENPNDYFQSRGYITPCTENVDDQELECDDSCYRQGANYGRCSGDDCQCIGIPAN